MMLDRRTFAKLALAANAALLLGRPAHAAEGLRFGPPKPFSYDLLVDRARALAGAAYAPAPRPDPAIVAVRQPLPRAVLPPSRGPPSLV
jgi:glucans biosynthesis protein